MTDRVLAVGQAVGAFGNESADYRTVRIGDEYLDLRTAEYDAWLFAADAADSAELRRSTADSGVEDVDAVIARLLDVDAIVRFDVEDDLRALFAGYRLVAQGHGLGNTAGDLSTFTVADPRGTPLARMSATLYGIWSVSWKMSMWQACLTCAESSGQSVEAVAGQLADQVAVVQACRAWSLDTVP